MIKKLTGQTRPLLVKIELAKGVMYFSILICLKLDLVILCFFCSHDNVQTNVAGSFLCLIVKHLPKSHVLHKIVNRNNVKVSYSCMNNMARVIKSPNEKILGKDDASPANNNQCNCRKKDLCRLDGACLINNIVYKATVTTVSDNASLKIQPSLPFTPRGKGKRRLNFRLPTTQEFSLAWQSTVSKRGSATTRFLWNIPSTRTLLSYPSTSGTLKTTVSISLSSGP